eukprot:scaffold404577_cov71-Attheya_sp.AAC.2
MIVPRLCADPSHRKKVFRNALYALKEKTKSKPLDERCTDKDIMKVSTYWAYMIRQNANKPFEELVAASKSVLEHHFNNHEFCGSWCRVKQGINDGKYRSKTEHKKLYESLQVIMATYGSRDKLKELHHNYTTQGNEAMNTSIASYAPKTKTYSTTMSLHNRVKMAAAIQIVVSKERGKRRTKLIEVKRKRQERFYEKIKKAIEADERAKRKGLGTYRTGAAIHDRSDINEFRGATSGAVLQPCIDCGEYDHKTSRSQKCQKNEKFDPTTAAKRCPDCERRGHASVRSKLCPKHAANLPVNNVAAVAVPDDRSGRELSELPLANARVAEEIVESDLVEKETEVNFGTVAASSDRENEVLLQHRCQKGLIQSFL